MLNGSRLVYLIVYVNDLVESSAFYRDCLGLSMVGQDKDSTMFDAGQIVIYLQRASDHDVRLIPRRDDSSDIVFLVEDLEDMRSALEARGVEFVRRRSYEVGLVTDFYDPNGHRLMLYQPSETSLTWPSADKLREIWRTSGQGGDEVIGPAAAPSPGSARKHGLAGKPVIYLFMFENDQTTAFEFYRNVLGLTLLERVHCCNQECAEEIEGIAKYDGGGVLLATHHVHEASLVVDDRGVPYSPKEFNPKNGKGIAPVFHVDRINRFVARLSARGVHFKHVERVPMGGFAKFEDPFGHPFFLFEASADPPSADTRAHAPAASVERETTNT